MKLTVKTIKGEIFKIDVEPITTISEVKEKIFSAKQFPIQCQKLIQKGNVIEDAKTIADYNIKEGDFIVVMIIKAPQKPVIVEKIQEEVKQEPVNQNKIQIEEEKREIQEEQQSKPIEKPNSQQQQQQQQDQQQQQPDISMKFVTGTAYDQAIQEILAMGFNKPDVVQAMMAAYNNPDRAIDYLINGIPQLEQDVLQLANQYDYHELAGQQASNENQEQNNARIESSQSEESSNNPMDQEIQDNNEEPYVLEQTSPLYFLANNPIFLQLKQQISNNPSLLSAILSQLQQSNQQLYQLISDNQQEFLRLIHSNIQIQGQNQQQQDLASQNSGSQNSEGSGQNSSAVSEEDEEAIQRLCQLGFSREIVFQAFMLCGKDENMAANYLFEVDVQGANQQQEQEMQE